MSSVTFYFSVMFHRSTVCLLQTEVLFPFAERIENNGGSYRRVPRKDIFLLFHYSFCATCHVILEDPPTFWHSFSEDRCIKEDPLVFHPPAVRLFMSGLLLIGTLDPTSMYVWLFKTKYLQQECFTRKKLWVFFSLKTIYRHKKSIFHWTLYSPAFLSKERQKQMFWVAYSHFSLFALNQNSV